jgi:hypothetical protein
MLYGLGSCDKGLRTVYVVLSGNTLEKRWHRADMHGHGAQVEQRDFTSGRVIKSLWKNLPEFIQNTFSLLKTLFMLCKNLVLGYTVPLLCSKF